MNIDEKLKQNKRNRRGQLKGHKTYYDKKRGIVFIDEDIIKKRLSFKFKRSFA